MDLFNVIFYHGGNFVHGKFMFYNGGNETIVHVQDPDIWSYFEVVSLVRDWGYVRFRLRRQISGVHERYFHFIDDKKVEEIDTHCIPNNVDAHIWVEHDV
ncbi:unnamed protein product [Lathyrus oleraceus]